MTTVHHRLALLAGLILLLAPASRARSQTRQDSIVRQATDILDDVTARNKKGLPPLILRHAYAVAIFPNMVKGGFILGGRHGEGVVLVRGPDGSFSYPFFVDMGGGSIGLQAGIQHTDLVLAFKNRQTVDGFLQGKGKLTMGVDGNLALGGIGRHAEVGTGAALKSQYTAYSRNRGLFLGAAVDGASLAINWDSTALYYGRQYTPQQIITGGTRIPVPESGLTLQTLLMEKSRLVPLEEPGVIVEGDAPATIPGAVISGGVAPPPQETLVDDVPIDSNLDDLPPARQSTPLRSQPAPAPRRPAPPRDPEPALDPAPNPEDVPALEPLPPAGDVPAASSRARESSAVTTGGGRVASRPPSDDLDLEPLPRMEAGPGALPYSSAVTIPRPQLASATGRSGSVDRASYQSTQMVADSGRTGWRRAPAPQAVQDSITGVVSRPADVDFP